MIFSSDELENIIESQKIIFETKKSDFYWNDIFMKYFKKSRNDS